MTVIAARRYRNGKVVGDVDIHCPRHDRLPAGEFVWIGLHEPDAEELAQVGTCFGLHPLAQEDARKGKQLPKLELYGDQLFLILRTAHLEGDLIGYGETSVFLGADFIVTVRHGSARAHSDLRARLESAPAALAHGPDYVLHAIMDFIVDGYFPVVDALEEQVLAMEAAAGEAFLDSDQIRQIFATRREIVRFQRILGVMSDVAGRMVNHVQPNIDENMLPYFRDVLDHVRRVEYRVAGLRDYLTSVAETSSLLEQRRQGDITRMLAAWAAILAVPTAIAGIYGMNFSNMPELQWRYGYFIVLGGIAIICALLYRRFRKLGWL
ncbi:MULTISPECIES: magnesium and cobalt transport protein CorA [unclassified Sphingobium]|uniref:magnesium and cobalt transport protein CorA n=1 Tax=unclassified Sphingobium TaxID=2611147 RepID=UPI002224CF4D|nr:MULTISPECIES: magnesium and cobalt transport protein CorA [unclassified Sphingobium]MCW2410279.1 magnesium transporter [Sphingobium sp. B8D3D]MCW2414029.1 magnesium transporter [Sphingobium sp. B8D3A]